MKHRFYHIYFMASLVISLLIVILCFKLPHTFHPTPKLWTPQLKLHRASFEQSKETVFPSMIPTHSRTALKPQKDSTKISIEDSVPNIRPLRPTTTVPVLKHAEIMPKIRGGLGAYYILIDYPEKAISQGIEGSLVLTFTVNKDGSTSNIVVSKPLHALLDSAAVKALRQAHFIPGQNLGESVRVQMRLPVRFKLVKPVEKELPPSEKTPK